MSDEPRDPLEASRLQRTTRFGGLVAGQSARWAATRMANVARSDDDARRAMDARAFAVAEELVTRLGEMKGAAMKLGQVLSTVELTAVPEGERERFKAKLAELRDDVPPAPFKKVRKVIEQDLGGPLDDVFEHFEERAFAAASIGQVHRATTLDGRPVAVKVQYPGVAEAVEADLRNIGMILPLIKRLAPGLDVKAVAAELRERISEELDYELEAQNQRMLHRAYTGHPFVVVPRVDTGLSTRRVLVSEYVDGRPFGEVRELDEPARDRFGEILMRFFFATVSNLAMSLGDPHPGNYLLCDDGRVCFLDFGLVRKVDPDHLAGEQALAVAIAEGDAQGVHDQMSALGYLPDPGSFEPEGLLEQTRTAGDWLFEPGFRRFSPDYVRDLIETGSSPRSPYFDQMRRQTLPPASLLMRRMEGLLLSVLGDLRAGADWAGITMEYVAGAPPVSELGRQDAAFWAP